MGMGTPISQQWVLWGGWGDQRGVTLTTNTDSRYDPCGPREAPQAPPNGGIKKEGAFELTLGEGGRGRSGEGEMQALRRSGCPDMLGAS